jgi:UDP-N-acetylmuramoyl-L-alanyl-D-glutamate--2,6-diaminopimelate ligase
MLESALLRAPDASSGGSFVTGSSPSAVATNHPEGAGSKPLAELVAAVPEARVHGDASVAVTGITYRSSEVRPGWLFFCVPGTKADGHRFAGEVCRSGSSAIVVERWLDIDCPQVLVPATREAMGPMSARFFDRPADRLTLVGVTGTNGKTTTTFLLESIFRSAGLVPGVIGTTGVRIDGRPVPFERTTPEAPDLQRLLAHMVEEGVRAAAMEVSSHGLHQHRVDGARFACAVFTNLSQDHLDYHGTIEDYFAAKARLFTPELSDRAAVNNDSPEGRRLVGLVEVPTVTFGLEHGSDLRATEVEVSTSGIGFTVEGRHYRSRLRGTFNVYNCLGALAAAREVGIDGEAVEEGLAALAGVPGRLEPVEIGQPFMVLVDYAHTPDSLENVLLAARKLTTGRLLVVFGCGGDRDRGKRPLMGEVATRLADLTILTSDNPRSEEPVGIISEIEPGARLGGGPFVAEPDRRAAIRTALAEARPGDVLLIAGKGHETGQEFRDRSVPFDDRVVAAEEITALLEVNP